MVEKLADPVAKAATRRETMTDHDTGARLELDAGPRPRSPAIPPARDSAGAEAQAHTASAVLLF